MGAFGDKFRKAREKKDISLDDVSNVTKISSRMLQAIEQERFDQLPGGVFNKGFIRAYAKHLGLNDEEAVTDYLACLRQAQIDAHEVWQPDAPAPPRAAASEKSHSATSNPDLKKLDLKKPDLRKQVPQRPDPKKPAPAKPSAKPQPAPLEELPDLQLPRAEHIRPRQRDFSASSSPQIPWRILALTAAVIVLAVIFWTRRSHGTNAAAAGAPAKITQPAPVSVAITATTPSPTTPTAKSPTAKTSAHADQLPTRARAPISEPATAQPQSTAAAAATHPASPASAQLTANAGNADKNPIAPDPSDNNDVTVRTFPQSNPLASDKSANLTLIIRATETSWISVTADGQPVSHETLFAPAHTSVRANHEIVARIGNAAGVTFIWNGQEIPADGAEAEVKTFVFDSAGMRVIPTTPPPTH